MLLCLEYLHKNAILHRDIKPENLVFDEQGYLRVTDLGIARLWNPENSKDTSGTPGYMAPEVMCRQNHGVAVDYFAMGVIAYECMFGKRPYHGKDRKEIRDHILSKQVRIHQNEIPRGWSPQAADFINRLIQRKPANRLGKEGPQVLKDHEWFAGFDWESLIAKRMQAPFIPPIAEDNFDAKYTNSEWKDANSEQMLQHKAKLNRPSI
jgi:serine/threonine protein kinase